MSTKVKVAGFLAALVATFAITFGIGKAVGDDAPPPEPATETHQPGH
ncbi:hypothetical protein [Epidermidibacterium keratini]|nr:hypothetical protein [Epidermidibacterium keratini]